MPIFESFANRSKIGGADKLEPQIGRHFGRFSRSLTRGDARCAARPALGAR